MSNSDKKRNNGGNQTVFTKETLGVTFIIFSTLLFVFLITGDAVFGKLGTLVDSFLYGIFGKAAYLVLFYGMAGGVSLITDKKLPIPRKTKRLGTLAVVCIVAFVHVLTVGNVPNYGDYLSRSYDMGKEGFSGASGGGFFTSLFAYFFSRLTVAGGAVVLAVLACVCIYFLVADVVKSRRGKTERDENKLNGTFVTEQPLNKTENVNASESLGGATAKETVYAIPVKENAATKTSRLFINNGDDFGIKTKRETKKANGPSIIIDSRDGGLPVGNVGVSYTDARVDDLKKKIEYIKTPAPIDLSASSVVAARQAAAVEPPRKVNQAPVVSDVIKTEENHVERKEEKTSIPMFEHDGNKTFGRKDDANARARMFEDKYADTEEPSVDVKAEPQETVRPFTDARSARAGIFGTAPSDDKKEEPLNGLRSRENATSVFDEKFEKEEIKETPLQKEEVAPPSRITHDERINDILFGGEKQEKSAAINEGVEFESRAIKDGNAPRTDFTSIDNRTPALTEIQPVVEEKPKKVVPINREYFRPPLDLLETYTQSVDASEENHEEKLETIRQTLEDFHINVEPQGYVQGPSITRYEIMMPAGISVKKVLSYDDDLRMRLASRNGVRIEAPIPGKNLVGIEVANKHRVTVGLKEVLEGSAGRKTKKGELIFALGKDIVGNAITDNLAKGPHYLVAGATGSGKSVCLNVMLVSMIMRYSPEDLRLVLIDPKRVGFRIYEHLPHLLIDEIITEPQRCLAVLAWAYEEMERRYKLFEECDEVVSDINAYNDYVERTAKNTTPRLARIVIVVDELADLMETCKKDLDARIRALAAKARAAGIHLVLATQRPSVDVITGTIKANLPSRIALKVMNFIDSQTILSEAGAEKLLGNGDMLYKNSAMPECERYQGAWISDREINNVVSYIIENNEAYFDDELTAFLDKETKPKQEESVASSDDGGEDEFDELFLKALALAINTGTASISQFQRRFQIGYARAGGIVDRMERYGFISGNEGSKARKALISREEFEQRFGPMPDTF